MKKRENNDGGIGEGTGEAAKQSSRLGPGQRFVWGLPLTWQLGLLYALLVMLTLSLVGWLVYSQQEGFLVQDTSQRMITQSERIAAISQPPPDGHDGQGASKGDSDDHNGSTIDHEDLLVRNFVQGLSGPGIRVAVLDTKGTVISTTQALDNDSSPVMPAVSAEQVRQALESGQEQWTVKGEDGTRQVVVLTAFTVQSAAAQETETASQGTKLLLEQVSSLAAADAALGQLRLLLLLGVIGGTIVGVVLVLVFTRGVLRPLERVVNTADAISAGDLQRRLELPAGRSEVAHLGKAFDSMVGRLVATLESQRRFVADASHELRTPLTSLKGLAEILVTGAHGNNPRVMEQSAQAINSELERLIRLVTELLTLSRLDNAGARGTVMAGSSKTTGLDACTCIDAAVIQMSGLAARRKVELSKECAGPLQIVGDEGQIKQVMLNLLDNALRYTPEGGRVTVRGKGERGLAVIEVEDKGAGIGAADLPHIFERFYRGDSSRSRATGNSGLGLAIVKSIVEAHGGTIEARSQLGEGTCFTVRLPLAQPAQPAVAQESRLKQASNAANR